MCQASAAITQRARPCDSRQTSKCRQSRRARGGTQPTRTARRGWHPMVADISHPSARISHDRTRGAAGTRRYGPVVAPSVDSGPVVGRMSSLMRRVRSRYWGGTSAPGAGVVAGGGGSAVTSVS